MNPIIAFYTKGQSVTMFPLLETSYLLVPLKATMLLLLCFFSSPDRGRGPGWGNLEDTWRYKHLGLTWDSQILVPETASV